MTEERAFQMITEAFDDLKEAGMVEESVSLDKETILLGVGSPVDSIGFVTFITALEEKLVDETGKDLYLVLNEIHQFNVDQPHLTADGLARYLVQLCKEQPA